MNNKYTGEQLDAALYNVGELLGMCMVPYILLKETAKDVAAGPERLNEGTGIYVGIPKNSVTPELKSLIRTFKDHVDLTYGNQGRIVDFKEDENGYSWMERGVPVYIQIIHRSYEFFKRPDFKFYRLEEYRIPNPFDKYWKARFLIQ